MTEADAIILIEGQAGRVTLNRPKALNALTAEMAVALENTLDQWRDDPTVKLVILDAEGSSFCAGGDIADLYEAGRKGDFEFGRAFWRQEYRLNYKISTYPKPVVSFLQGFTMGGGVGVGCHASHRIVGESSKISMPECTIGLIPDVGGSLLLANAPGNFGIYLGLTGARMKAADAIHADFADHYVPETEWNSLKRSLVENDDAINIPGFERPKSNLVAECESIASAFEYDTLAEISSALQTNPSEAAQKAFSLISNGSPIALACALQTIRAAKGMTLADALRQEYRFSYRAQNEADFLEGIRALIIDKDFSPKWKHTNLCVPSSEVSEMLAPLGQNEWQEDGELS